MCVYGFWLTSAPSTVLHSISKKARNDQLAENQEWFDAKSDLYRKSFFRSIGEVCGQRLKSCREQTLTVPLAVSFHSPRRLIAESDGTPQYLTSSVPFTPQVTRCLSHPRDPDSGRPRQANWVLIIPCERCRCSTWGSVPCPLLGRQDPNWIPNMLQCDVQEKDSRFCQPVVPTWKCAGPTCVWISRFAIHDSVKKTRKHRSHTRVNDVDGE